VSISGITAVTCHLPTVIVNKIATSQRQSAVGVQHAEKKKRKKCSAQSFELPSNAALQSAIDFELGL